MAPGVWPNCTPTGAETVNDEDKIGVSIGAEFAINAGGIHPCDTGNNSLNGLGVVKLLSSLRLPILPIPPQSKWCWARVAKHRHLSKDYERLPQMSECFVYPAMTAPML